MAHRGQLRLSKAQKDLNPIIRWSPQQLQPAQRATSEEFHGFSEIEMLGRKRKRAVDNMASEIEISPESAPRRSKRSRKLKMDKDYVYMKF